LGIVLAAGIAATSSASTAVIYSNDFETITSGFTNGGVLPALTRESLPTDGGGLSSANQSMWLGRLGAGIGKSAATVEIVDLAISGLTPGWVCAVAFDLLIGLFWDGAADGYDADSPQR
jgi:hypothetical protein